MKKIKLKIKGNFNCFSDLVEELKRNKEYKINTKENYLIEVETNILYPEKEKNVMCRSDYNDAYQFTDNWSLNSVNKNIYHILKKYIVYDDAEYNNHDMRWW